MKFFMTTLIVLFLPIFARADQNEKIIWGEQDGKPVLLRVRLVLSQPLTSSGRVSGKAFIFDSDTKVGVAAEFELPTPKNGDVSLDRLALTENKMPGYWMKNRGYRLDFAEARLMARELLSDAKAIQAFLRSHVDERFIVTEALSYTEEELISPELPDHSKKSTVITLPINKPFLIVSLAGVALLTSMNIPMAKELEDTNSYIMTASAITGTFITLFPRAWWVKPISNEKVATFLHFLGIFIATEGAAVCTGFLLPALGGGK